MEFSEEIIKDIFEYLPFHHHLFLIHHLHISSISLNSNILMKFGKDFEKLCICKKCMEILNDSLKDDLMMEYGNKFYGDYCIPTEDEKEEIAQEKWETESEEDEKMDLFLHKTAKRIYQMCFMEYLYESGQMEDFNIKGKCILHLMNIDFDPEWVYQNVISVYRKGIENYVQDEFCKKCGDFHLKSSDCFC